MLAKLKSPIGCALAAALFLGACLVTLVALGKKEDPYLAEVALPGSKNRLRLLSTTAGPLDYNWKPPRFENWIPRPGVSYVPPIQVKLTGLDSMTSQPGHTFLFRTVDERGKYTQPMQMISSFEFVESTGYVFRRFGFADYPHWGTYALTRSCLPRRDKELTIRIKPDSAKKPFVEMKIPNPVYKENIQEWQPESLPIKKTVENLTAHLEEIRYQSSPFGSGHLHCQIRGESPSLEWTNGGFTTTFEDATGNRGEELSPFEPAWKVVARAYRNWATPFPAELVTPRVKIPILGLAKVQALDQEFTVDGQKFRLRCVSGPGVTTETPSGFTSQLLDTKSPDKQHQYTSVSFGYTSGQEQCSATSAHPIAWIETEPPKNHEQIVVQLISSEGSITPCPMNISQSSNRYLLIAELKPPSPEVQEIELQIAISRPRIVEFLVEPPEEARTYWKTQAAVSEGKSP
jgi:hypothetical protein